MFTNQFKFVLIFLFILIISNFSSIKSIILPINIKKDKIFYFYTTLYYGDQKSPQDFILDTTNTFISSPCNLCETCGYHSNEWYNITNKENQILSCNDAKCGGLSGKCENNQCLYKYDYYENAFINGILVNEKISFKNNTSSDSDSKSELYDITIGCTINETNYIIAEDSDGIMGLNNDENSFVNMLFNLKIIPKNLFTIFLNQNNTGYLALGEINNHEKINYVPYTVDEEKYYNLQINSFEINGKEIKYEVNAIIDTTSTLCSFPNDLYDSIIKEFEENCPEQYCGKFIKNRHFGFCAIFTDEQDMITKISNWIDITINFKDYKYIWKPGNYWVNISSDSTFRACLGFEKTEENIITLGTTFLHGYDIIFNHEDKNIGFAPMNPEGKISYSNLNITNLLTVNNKNQKTSQNKDGAKINKNTKSSYSSSNNNLKVDNGKERGVLKKTFRIFCVFVIITILIIGIINRFKQKKKMKKKKLRKLRIVEKERKKFLP